MDELLFKNVRIVLDGRLVDASLYVSDGRIAGILAPASRESAPAVVDGRGLIALPGLVDAHVHACQPGNTEWEGFRSATRAAAAGGVTTVVDMPLSCTPTISAAALTRKRADLASDAVVDYALWGGLTDDNVEALPGLVDAGAVGLKAFMTDSMQEFGWAPDDVLFRGMAVAARRGAVVAVHCESEAIVGPRTRRALELGDDTWEGYLSTRPPIAERDASARATGFAAETGARLHIVHCSVPDVVDLAPAAKGRGVDVTVETCPQYLALSDSDLARLGNPAKCSPPVRSKATVDQLWERVLGNAVDTIGSDHAPCRPGLKDPAVGPLAAGHGILGLQTMLPVLLTEGVHRRGLPLDRVIEMTSTRPAKRLGLWPAKGGLHLGADADLVLIDPDAPWQFRAERDMYSVQRINPWDQSIFRYRVVATYVRGREAYSLQNGPADPGFGRTIQSVPTPQSTLLRKAE